MPQEPSENRNAVLSYSCKNKIARVTFERPEKYNTLTSEVITEMQDLLDIIAKDSSIHVLVIASKGKAFCTGHDIKEMSAKRDENFYRELLFQCSKMMQQLLALPQPVIAQVQGIATAAGCQLVATCDLVVASESARFATNGIDNGLYCATPSVALSRVVPRKHSLEMLLTGDFITSHRATEIGLVNRVVEDGQLEFEVTKLASRLAEHPRTLLSRGKASFYRQINQPIDIAYKGTSEDLVCNLLEDEGQEGLTAFVEKRPPAWKSKPSQGEI